jgi:hypothetical protein
MAYGPFRTASILLAMPPGMAAIPVRNISY